MVQFSSVLFAQIRFLVQNLYKKNAKNNIAEVRPARPPVPRTRARISPAPPSPPKHTKNTHSHSQARTSTIQ
jgi:hypothetical protein